MKLQRVTRPQVEKYFKTNDTVMIGTGSTENHGTHLSPDTDALVPEKIIDLLQEWSGAPPQDPPDPPSVSRRFAYASDQNASAPVR